MEIQIKISFDESAEKTLKALAKAIELLSGGSKAKVIHDMPDAITKERLKKASESHVPSAKTALPPKQNIPNKPEPEAVAKIIDKNLIEASRTFKKDVISSGYTEKEAGDAWKDLFKSFKERHNFEAKVLKEIPDNIRAEYVTMLKDASQDCKKTGDTDEFGIE